MKTPAELEVLLELAPLVVGGFAVLGRWSHRAACVDEGPVGADEVVLEGGLWRRQIFQLSESPCLSSRRWRVIRVGLEDDAGDLVDGRCRGDARSV